MPDVDSSQPTTERIDIATEANRIVPKLATKVGIAKSVSGSLILSFLCALPDEKPYLIERIVVDKQTADEFIAFLRKMEENDDA